MSDKTSQNQNGQERADVNRANAQFSTGPRTEAGKKRSSLNALRHGLTGHVIVLPGEDLAAYERNYKEASDQFQPANWNEEQLVKTLADISWQLNRISALEINTLSLGLSQRAGEIGSDNPDLDDALAIALSARDQSQTLANYSIYRQRLSRERERTLKQLQELQAKRKEQEAESMKKAATSCNCIERKDFPTSPPTMGSFFQIRRSKLTCAAKSAWRTPKRPHKPANQLPRIPEFLEFLNSSPQAYKRYNQSPPSSPSDGTSPQP